MSAKTLLVELFTEELPPKALGRLGEAFAGGLEAGLAKEGLSPRDVTHVLLTHIHLDHAGAAGWMAKQGAQVYVHPVGAPHMLNPEKLIASATRIYGDRMQALWGEFLPVPEDQLVITNDAEEIKIGGLRFIPINTPGHAEHHFVYLFDDVCFSGDIGGIRPAGTHHLRLPMPPPEFILEKWRSTLQRLRTQSFHPWPPATHPMPHCALEVPTQDPNDGPAIGAAYANPRPGDSIFTYQHRTRGASGRSCVMCHVSHGTSAQMPGPYSSTYTFPDGTASNNSRLLKVDNRGTCQLCHDPTGTSAAGDQYPPAPYPVPGVQ